MPQWMVSQPCMYGQPVWTHKVIKNKKKKRTHEVLECGALEELERDSSRWTQRKNKLKLFQNLRGERLVRWVSEGRVAATGKHGCHQARLPDLNSR